MATYLGNTQVTGIYLGTAPIQGIYVGTTQVYASGPSFASVSPTQGVVGTSVTITGSGFGGGTPTVTIGGTAATGVSVSSDTSLTCTVPSLARGTQDIVITVAGVSVTASSAFTVQALPTITNVYPTSGVSGDGILINGTNFSLPAIVTIGGLQAGGLSILSTSQLLCTVPALTTAGAKDIEVATSDGRITASNAFTFYKAPTFSSVSPTSGTAGTSITISGSGFGSGASPITVTIDGVSATNVAPSTTLLSCTVPTLTTAGAKTIAIVTPGGTATGSFTYNLQAPTYTGISPNYGTAGTTITINGTNFAPSATTVTVGGVTASGVNVSSSTALTCTVPSGLASNTAHNVTVTTSGGSATGPGAFTNYNAPTISSTSPATIYPGTTGTISGTNFVPGGTTVAVGGVAATVTATTSTSITFTTPTIGSEGTKAVAVTTPGGTISTATTYYNIHSPATTIYMTVGSGNYTIPAWCNKIDVIVVGSGGGGNGGGAGFNNGGGGGAGTFSASTIIRGTDINWTYPTLSYSIGAVGAGAPNATGPGTNGSATTAASEVPNKAISGAGGVGGKGQGTQQAGYAPGGYTFNGVTYNGGSGGSGGLGSPYTAAGAGTGGGGGGGGGGILVGLGTPGGAGGPGIVWFRAYQ